MKILQTCVTFNSYRYINPDTQMTHTERQAS